MQYINMNVTILPLKTVENCTSETKRLFINHHGHEEEEDCGSVQDGGELLLVLVTASDDIVQGLDGLGEHVSREVAGQEDGCQEAEDTVGADRGMAGGHHLALVGR